MKTRYWIIMIAAVAAAAAAATVLVRFLTPAGATAEIVKDGVVIRRIDLDAVVEEYSFTVGEEGDRNVITVKPGAVCVSSADCPDKICVAHGWVTKDDPYPAVCLPHKLTVRIAGADE